LFASTTQGEPNVSAPQQCLAHFNGGGGPTDDKTEVIASPPHDPNVLSIFLDFRVTDIRRYYDLWGSRGAKFIVLMVSDISIVALSP
jgi:hypothetical protein